MGTAATELGNQNAMEIIRSWAGRGHIVAFSGQRQSGFAQKGERNNQHSLIYTEAIASFWDILKEQWWKDILTVDRTSSRVPDWEKKWPDMQLHAYFHKEGKKEYVWNTEDCIDFLSILLCLVIKVNGKL